MRRLRFYGVLTALAVVAASCQSTPGGVEGGTAEAFCGPAVEAQVAMARGPDVDFGAATQEEINTALGEFAERVDPLIDELEANAPEELQDEVATVASGSRSAIETGDQAALESDEYEAAEHAVDQFIVDNCAIESHQVEGFDYGYNNVPATVPAGQVAFEFDNTGDELHELVVFRINDESLTVDQLLEMPEEEAMGNVTFSGVAFAEPGNEDILLTDLEAGRYAIVCFIPVGTESFEDLPEDEGAATQPPHFTQGMDAEFSVEG